MIIGKIHQYINSFSYDKARISQELLTDQTNKQRDHG